MTFDQLRAGARVSVVSRDANGNIKKVYGTLGRLLGNPIEWIIQLDSGHVGRIVEANIARIFIEESN
jgi:hypothetical protein